MLVLCLVSMFYWVFKCFSIYRWMFRCLKCHLWHFSLYIHVYITNILWPFGTFILDLFNGFDSIVSGLLCVLFIKWNCVFCKFCVLECINECLSVFYTSYNIFRYVLAFIFQMYFSILTRSSWNFSMAFDSVVSGWFYVQFMLWMCVLCKFYVS